MQQTNTYHYRMIRSNASSEKLGPCEVCKKFVSDVHHQIEAVEYQKESDKTALTYHGCRNLFGHEQCLIAQRR
jgi:hypothetical protein